MDETNVEVHYKHSLMTRWMHWVNVPLLTLMVVSGVFIYWANPAYTTFIPRDWYKLIAIDYKLAFGMGIHFFFMWFFALNGLAFVAWLFISGEWRELRPRRSSFREAFLVTLRDLGFRVVLPPQGKFNSAQKIAYTGIIVLGGFQLLTGLAIYKPVSLSWLLALFGGYEFARLLHFIATGFFVLFFVTHVAQVVRAGWNNFRSMISGWEEKRDEA